MKLLCLFLLLPWLAFAQDSSVSGADLEAGARLFRANCAICHGLEGKGGRGSDLTRAEYRHGNSDEEVFRVILNGAPGTEMPPIFFEGRQMWQIVGYLRSLRRGSGVETAPASADPGLGREIVTGKGGCLSCHRLDGRGGHSGPDLRAVAQTLTRAEILQALRDPQAVVLPEYWRVKARTKDGRVIQGRRLNEDTYSLQVMDKDGALRSLPRNQIESLEVSERSIMPSFADKLTESELEAVAAFLGSLR